MRKKTQAKRGPSYTRISQASDLANVSFAYGRIGTPVTSLLLPNSMKSNRLSNTVFIIRWIR